jgi:hypothetical protein
MKFHTFKPVPKSIGELLSTNVGDYLDIAKQALTRSGAPPK